MAKLARASKAKIKIGPLSKLSSFFTYNKGVWQKRSKSEKNEGKYNLDLIRQLDPDLFQKEYELETKIYIEDKHREAVDMFFKTNNIKGQSIVINPFIGGSAKNIKDEEYVRLIKNFKKRNRDVNVIITCHISDEERGLKLIKEANSMGVYLYANGGDLLNIAAIIDRCDVYLGASTGPTHMAGALKKRIVAIYPNKKTQSITRWGVLGDDKVDRCDVYLGASTGPTHMAGALKKRIVAIYPNKKTQSITRWGVLGDDKVYYLVPDKDNPKEDYKNPYFDTYDRDMELDLILALERALKLEEGGKN